MAVGERCAVLSPNVLVEIVFVCEHFALVVVYGDGLGLANSIAKGIVYAPLLQEASGIWRELKTGTDLDDSQHWPVNLRGRVFLLQQALLRLLTQ